MFTIAKVKNEALNGLPETFQVFVIKKDGREIGELKYDRGRWKSAGGPAWKGTLFSNDVGGNPTYYAKNKNEVLEWFKTGKMKR